ncbi:MAG TPA: hypothetical protein VD789_13570, partial [Thermomicrobiales bacterium]|nr:hypothetical protein [Thermomicrobiales bacterium]
WAGYPMPAPCLRPSSWRLDQNTSYPEPYKPPNGRGSRLAQPLAPFIGRQREGSGLQLIVSDPTVRLVTLTGPGGVGMTRLALQTGTDLDQHAVEIVVLVPLATITDAALVPSAIAETVGVSEGGVDSSIRSVALALGARRSLLVLDTFEHVLPASEWGGDLLVTSRAPLRLYGENRFPVSPLTGPATPTRDTALDPGEIGAPDAVSLIAMRARAILRTLSFRRRMPRL